MRAAQFRIRFRWEVGLAVLALLIAVVSMGCEQHSGLVGKWKGNFTMDNNSVTAVWEFKSDGTMTQKLDGSNSLKSCVFTVKGNEVTIIPKKQTTLGREDQQMFLNSEAPQVYTFKIYGDTLTLTAGGTDFQMTKTYI